MVDGFKEGAFLGDFLAGVQDAGGGGACHVKGIAQGCDGIGCGVAIFAVQYCGDGHVDFGAEAFDEVLEGVEVAVVDGADGMVDGGLAATPGSIEIRLEIRVGMAVEEDVEAGDFTEFDGAVEKASAFEGEIAVGHVGEGLVEEGGVLIKEGGKDIGLAHMDGEDGG